jgi:hypothetical protein
VDGANVQYVDDMPTESLSPADELAEIAATEARLAALERGEQPPAAAYVPTEAEIERSVGFARKVRPPVEAIVMDRSSGLLRGIVPNSQTVTLVTALMTQVRQQRPRERRERRTARTTSSRGDPSEPDPPDLALSGLIHPITEGGEAGG